jgi:hypothetical protein
VYYNVVIAARVHVIKEVGYGSWGDIIKQLQGKIAHRCAEIDNCRRFGGASRSHRHRQGNNKAEHEAIKVQLEFVQRLAVIH